MPRKAAEKLYPYNVRLTRSQIRKIELCGGPAWLRLVISRSQASKTGRDPIGYVRMIAARNRDIATSKEPSAVLAERYSLSVKRVQQIRRESLS